MKRDFGRRPLRLDRIFATGPLYFVTFCTHERQRFLAKDEVHTAFVLFAKRGDEFNVAVGRYVIMPDHVHLFVRGGRFQTRSMDRRAKANAGKGRQVVPRKRTDMGGRIFRSRFAKQ